MNDARGPDAGADETRPARAITGAGIDRVEGRLKVSGKTPYGPETAVANVAHAVIVGAAAAPGRVESIETRDAERAPGVLRVITHLNAPRLPGAAHNEPGERVLQLLQDARVFYNDQPLAVVVADTLENAQHAASLVRAVVRAEKPQLDLGSHLAEAYAPDKTPRGPTDTHTGDFDRAYAAAAYRINATYTTPVHNHNPMEPHGTIAVWNAADRVTLYDATQGISGVRKRIAKLFGLPLDGVRVISLFVGGGFGCKGTPWSHVPLAVMAARVLGRPVKLVLTRHQMFSLVGHRPVTRQQVALGADGRGRLVAVRHDVFAVTSRFDEFVEPSAAQTRMSYACPNIRTSHRLVRLDVSTPTFTRAPGEASGSFALESAMDELSYALKLDPLELRLRNYAERDPESGKPFSSKSLRACYQQAAERFGWARRRAAVRATRKGNEWVGWGMATATYPAGQSPSQAVARIRADGTALVQAGTQDLGTGTYTIMSQIAADVLGLPVERVRFELGDTRLPEAPLSAGSRTAASVGPAVKGASEAVRAAIATLALADTASPLYEMPRADVVFADGCLVDARDSARRDPFQAILKRAGRAEIEGRFAAEENPARKEHSLHSFGAQFAEVHVDADLGQVRVTRFVGAFAGGKILNAKTARSQFIGGIVWGIGMALHEEALRDPRTGRVVTRDLADYHVPVHLDVPSIEIISIDETDPIVNAVGAKGIGEIGITGAAAAIANAVYHATGVRVRDLPITPDKLLG
jgi:xanthine dehydrogenase YagR molybdenum-binding subunit